MKELYRYELALVGQAEGLRVFGQVLVRPGHHGPELAGNGGMVNHDV